MEMVVALFEIIGMTIAFAASICGLCFMAAVIYIAYKEREELEKEYKGDADD